MFKKKALAKYINFKSKKDIKNNKMFFGMNKSAIRQEQDIILEFLNIFNYDESDRKFSETMKSICTEPDTKCLRFSSTRNKFNYLLAGKIDLITIVLSIKSRRLPFFDFFKNVMKKHDLLYCFLFKINFHVFRDGKLLILDCNIWSNISAKLLCNYITPITEENRLTNLLNRKNEMNEALKTIKEIKEKYRNTQN